MRKELAVYYHIWSPPHSNVWRLLVDEQIKRIFRSGLPNAADIYCCISGEQADKIEKYISLYPWLRMIESTTAEGEFEGLTLKYLWQDCKATTNNLKGVCYIHTKGISYVASDCADGTFRAINSWRHFLEWGTLDRWRDILPLLPSFEIVGVNFQTKPWPHVSGNFWWARPSYISRLCDPNRSPLAEGAHPRLRYEKWIGTGNPQAFSFYSHPHRSLGLDINAPAGLNLYTDDIEPYYRQNSI